MKTAELTGALLDYWVARAEGMKEPEVDKENDECVFIHHEEPGDDGWYTRYAPSTTWSEGGPLIEKYGLAVVGGCDPFWYSMPSSDEVYVGGEYPSSTPLVAICRAVVRSVYGEEVPE